MDGLLKAIFSLWASTWRIRYKGLDEFISASTRGIAVGLWHEDLCSVAFSMRKQAKLFHPVVSLSSDGDRAVSWLERFGYTCLRGSSSKGGSAVFGACITVLEGQGSVAITMDGPRGPRRLAKPGLFRLGHESGHLLWLVRTEARGWRLPTWDRQLIPWPFAQVSIHFRAVDCELTSLVDFQAWLNRQN